LVLPKESNASKMLNSHCFCATGVVSNSGQLRLLPCD
jgi:ribosomal protein L2